MGRFRTERALLVERPLLAPGTRRRLSQIVISAAALGMAVAVHDVWNPASVDWEVSSLSGVRVERAAGLVVQDRQGEVTWATIGFSIYRSVGAAPFERVHTLLPRPSEAWAGYSRTFRNEFRYQEL